MHTNSGKCIPAFSITSGTVLNASYGTLLSKVMLGECGNSCISHSRFPVQGRRKYNGPGASPQTDAFRLLVDLNGNRVNLKTPVWKLMKKVLFYVFHHFFLVHFRPFKAHGKTKFE